MSRGGGGRGEARARGGGGACVRAECRIFLAKTLLAAARVRRQVREGGDLLSRGDNRYRRGVAREMLIVAWRNEGKKGCSGWCFRW